MSKPSWEGNRGRLAAQARHSGCTVGFTLLCDYVTRGEGAVSTPETQSEAWRQMAAGVSAASRRTTHWEGISYSSIDEIPVSHAHPRIERACQLALELGWTMGALWGSRLDCCLAGRTILKDAAEAGPVPQEKDAP